MFCESDGRNLQFGFEGIPIKRLQTISEQAFQDASAVPDERMLCLAWKLFTENAYSEPVLKYLMRFSVVPLQSWFVCGRQQGIFRESLWKSGY